MPKNNSAAIRKERKLDALDAQKDRDTMTAEEQVAALDARLGAGVGAVRERARLMKQLSTKRKDHVQRVQSTTSKKES